MPRPPAIQHPIVNPEFLAEVGRAAFGEGWQTSLGTALSRYHPRGGILASAHMSQWLKGDRSIPGWVVVSMGKVIEDLQQKLRLRIDDLGRIHVRFDEDMAQLAVDGGPTPPVRE